MKNLMIGVLISGCALLAFLLWRKSQPAKPKPEEANKPFDITKFGYNPNFDPAGVFTGEKGIVVGSGCANLGPDYVQDFITGQCVKKNPPPKTSEPPVDLPVKQASFISAPALAVLASNGGVVTGANNLTTGGVTNINSSASTNASKPVLGTVTKINMN